MVVHCRVVGRSASYRGWSRVTAIGEVVVGAAGAGRGVGLKVSSLVPLVVARQKVLRQTVAVRIRCVVTGIARGPQSDVVIDAGGGEFIGRLVPSARIEPVDEPRRFVLRNTGGRSVCSITASNAVRFHVIQSSSQVVGRAIVRVVLGDHIPTDLELANVVGVSHGTSA